MTKFFKKSKKLWFGGILHPFRPNLDKNEFSWKKGLYQFLNIPIIYHRAKSQKKLISHSWEKCRTDGRTDRQASDFMGPSVGRGSNKKKSGNNLPVSFSARFLMKNIYPAIFY